MVHTMLTSYTYDKDEMYARNIIKSLYKEGERILCGTNLGKIYSFDLKSRKFQLTYGMKTEYPVYYIGKNTNGDLIVGINNPSGLHFIYNEGKVTSRFPVAGRKPKTFAQIRCLLEISENRYLIGTRNDGLYDYNARTEELVQYKNDRDTKHTHQIPENYVSSIFKDSSGRIWIGTFGGEFSLFNPETGDFTIYNIKKGLLDNNICSIVEDKNKQLWISTISGISHFNPADKSFINYTHNNGISINEFTPHAGMMLANGRIVFTGNNGFITFDPSHMNSNPYIPPIVLRNLYIDNKPVYPEDKSGILSVRIDDQKEITLKHNQSDITIEYSALNYLFPGQNQYSYILEGFDKEWNEVGTRRTAYYTNIPSGKYRFIVKGSNNDGIWNNEGTCLTITVLPPYWKTWWAYCIYFLILIAIVRIILYLYNKRKRLENDIQVRQAEAKVQADFHEERNKLFTNFSHELRTPLTLIMSPLDDMIEKRETSPEKNIQSLKLMQGNARRLLRLVDNLMDFQKREIGKLKLKVSDSDFIKFSMDLTNAFNELALYRDITLLFKTSDKSLSYWFDKNLMEKVYFNFMSNAFKNVPNGGNIEVGISVANLITLQQLFPDRVSVFTNTEIQYIHIMNIQGWLRGIHHHCAKEHLQGYLDEYHYRYNRRNHMGTIFDLTIKRMVCNEPIRLKNNKL